MTAWVSQITGGFKEKWNNDEDNKEAVGENAKEIVKGSATVWKACRFLSGNSDAIIKDVAGKQKKDDAQAVRPAFLAGMLLNKKSKVFFNLTIQDIKGGGGKMALWVRHSLLTHIRDTKTGEKFLDSLASSTREGVESVWKDVLKGMGIPEKDRPGMIDKLVDETSWVSLTLVKEKVKAAVLGRIDAALGIAEKIRDDKIFIENFLKVTAARESEKERKAVLKSVGLSGSKAGKIVKLMDEGGKDAWKKAAAELKALLSPLIKHLEKVREEVNAMPLGKYNAILDFKIQRNQILKSVMKGKIKNNFLSAELVKATTDAIVCKIAGETAKAVAIIGSIAALSVVLPASTVAGMGALAHYTFHGGEILIHAVEVMHPIIESAECTMDGMLLLRLGVPTI